MANLNLQSENGKEIVKEFGVSIRALSMMSDVMTGIPQ